MPETDMNVSLPKKREDGETVLERLTDNAVNNIIPARYLIKDENGDPIEAPDELFERVSKNVSLAEAVFTDEDVEIRHEHLKPDHPRRQELIDEVFTDENGNTVEAKILEEGDAKWLSYDAVIDDLPEDTREVVVDKREGFQDMIEHLGWMPNSPTLMNAGDELQQLSACFVLSPEDDIDDIHDKAREAAKVFQSGGGTGYAFSYLRPYGDTVGSTGGIASGPITFMRTFDQMCRTIAQGGARRGAQMGVMRCTHPDIIQFIHAKNKDVSLAYSLRLNDPKDYRHTDFGEALGEARGLMKDGKVPDHLRNAAEGHLANFNISVTVTDEFMDAVKADEPFAMINPRTGEPHIATQETKDMYSWYGMGEHVTVGEPLEVPATELYDRMVDGAHENGEPGMLFIDAANRDHSFPTQSTPTDNREEDPFEMSTTNPCGEQWLMEYEACNLGHINLSTLVAEDAPDFRQFAADMQGTDTSATLENTVGLFLDQAIDKDGLNHRIKLGTNFLENVVTMSAFPVDKISETVANNRKIGLGIMGLAQMFVQMGIEYGSEESFEVTRQIMSHIDNESKMVSHELAQQRGSFANWEHSKYANPTEHAEWFERHVGQPADDFEDGFDIRNHNTVTIAPTGTTSMLGNTSGGCEPIYSVAHLKNVSQDVQGEEQLVEFDDYFLRVLEANDLDVDAIKRDAAQQMQANEFDGIEGLDGVPNEIGELFRVTADLSGYEHAGIQCAAQESVDSAISKTVNFPNEATKEDVDDVMMYLYDNGAKGGTIYRDGTRSKQVLSTNEDHGEGLLGGDDPDDLGKEEAEALVNDLVQKHELKVRQDDTDDGIDSGEVEPRSRGKVLESRTERMNTPEGSLYVTIGFDEDGEPFEVLSTIGKSGGFAESMVEGLCRMASQSLRAGVSVDEVIEQLVGIRGPDVSWDGQEQVRSIPDAIAKALRRAVEERNEAKLTIDTSEPGEGQCPECGKDLVVQEGCEKCPDGHVSHCG